MKRQDIKEKKTANWWKISLLILVTLLVVVLTTIGIRIFKPIAQADNTTNVINSNDSIFTVALTRKQVNRVSAEYVDDFLKNDEIKYKFNVSNKHANVFGTVKFLGADVDFKLILDPYVKENGDVQLRAKSLKLGSLPVPLGFVMNYIGNSYHLPDWVKMNSKKHIIDLKLTQYRTDTGYSVKARKIDLKNNKIKIEVFKKDSNK